MSKQRTFMNKLILTLVLLLSLLTTPAWAAIAWVQGKSAETVTTGPDTQAITWDSDTTTGNAIVCGLGSVLQAVTSVTDSQGNTYVVGPTTTQMPFVVPMAIASALNITGGTTPTVTATFTDGTTNRFMECAEFSGLAASSALDQQAGQAQTNPGTGTDAVTSGTVTTTVANELIVGWSCCFATPAAERVGTNFTRLSSVVRSGIGEYRIVSSTGNYAATYTTTSATDDFATRVATFKAAEAGGGGSTNSTCGAAFVLGIQGC